MVMVVMIVGNVLWRGVLVRGVTITWSRGFARRRVLQVMVMLVVVLGGRRAFSESRPVPGIFAGERWISLEAAGDPSFGGLLGGGRRW